MPGDNEITIGDKTWELRPFKGLSSIKMVPKLINIATELLWSAKEGGFSIDNLLTEDAVEKVPIDTLLQILNFASGTLGNRYDELALEIVPFLLQAKGKDKDWLWKEAPPIEVLKATWKAIRYHIDTTFGSDVLEALKNSVLVEEEEESQSPSTSPEASP